MDSTDNKQDEFITFMMVVNSCTVPKNSLVFCVVSATIMPAIFVREKRTDQVKHRPVG